MLTRLKRAAVLMGLALSFANGCGSATGSNDGGGGSGATGNGGRGGAGTGGAAGAAGSGGAGGASACQAVLALDRSCAAATDCFAAEHQTTCCGQREFIGMRTSAQAQYQVLEPKCEATYPACGCAEGQPTTDDGSKVQFNATPGVACVQGVCTTYAAECGNPCALGTTCFSCSNHGATFAACTTMCTLTTDCPDPTLPMCQFGSSGNTSGMFCTASGVACALGPPTRTGPTGSAARTSPGRATTAFTAASGRSISLHAGAGALLRGYTSWLLGRADLFVPSICRLPAEWHGRRSMFLGGFRRRSLRVACDELPFLGSRVAGCSGCRSG